MLRKFKVTSMIFQVVRTMSDALFRDRKLRRIKKESVKAQKLLKNKDRPKKRGGKSGK